jgi:hypothetical protein
MGIAFLVFFFSHAQDRRHQKLRLSQRHGAHLFNKNLGNQHTASANQLRLLNDTSDTEIKELRSAWIQTMNQGMGKGAKTGSTRRSSHEWFTSENK